MPVIEIAWPLAAGAFLTGAILELIVGALRKGSRIHLAFGLVSLAAAAGVLAESMMFQATAVGEIAFWTKWAVACNIGAHLALIWFMVQYAGGRVRWPAWMAGAVFAGAAVVHLMLPYGITFRTIDALESLALPWGEQIMLPSGPAHPLWPLSVGAIPLLLVFLASLVVQLRRAGQRRRAWRVAIAGSVVFSEQLALDERGQESQRN